MESPSHPTWNDLHPLFPEPMTRDEAIHHHNTKQSILALPRNILGIAILRALGMRLPMPPRPPQLVTREMVEESNRRIQKIREELAAEQSAGIVDTTEQAVEELHDSVTRSEAQTAFEAQMRAKALRGTFQA